jgi:hypothetical protein
VVAFAGDLKPDVNCAGRWNTNGGPGIFVAILQGGSVQQIVRVAGFASAGLGTKQIEDISVLPPLSPTTNSDGFCDPGEVCIPVGELETQRPPIGPPAMVYFKTFDPAVFPTSAEWQERIGVIHSDFGSPGIDGDSIIVSFLATPNLASNQGLFSANPGLWTVRVDMRTLPPNPPPPTPLTSHVFRPLPVIQIGDNLGSPLETVTSIEIYDPVAKALTTDAGVARIAVPGDHRIAFSIATSLGGQKIIRGSHLDTDGDGLLDHWEQFGVDFNGDGTLDLVLSNLDPITPPKFDHKDLYVEVDYMCTGSISAAGICSLSPGQHTHQPDLNPNTGTPVNVAIGQAPTLAVAAAFGTSPVPNPDGLPGINLHILSDEAIPEVQIMVWGDSSPNSFSNLKLGSGPCGSGAGIGHFGSIADRSSPNCANIIAARRLVTRYAIFGHQFSNSVDPLTPLDATGAAEIHGNDFIVALSAGANSAPCTATKDWADTAACVAKQWGTTFDEERASDEAGVLRHELGHTLGLFHGGSEPYEGYKPNYLSVMNYAFSLNNASVPDINLGTPADCKSVGAFQCRTNRPLDYSRSVLPPLDKASLSETNGIGGPAGGRTLWWIPLATGGANPVVASTQGPIDWNWSLVPPPDAAPVAADINNSGCGPAKIATPPKCDNPPNTTKVLTGFNDWSNLRYDFVQSDNFDLGPGLPEPQTPELTFTDALNLQVVTSAPVNVTVTISGSGSVSFAPSGVNCATTCTKYFATGTTLDLTPTPAVGSTFAGWSGGCNGTGICTLSLTNSTVVVAVTATFTAGSSASLTSVTPNVGQQGQTLAGVAIAGQNTNFMQGATVASFGVGITINSLTVSSATSATANITVQNGAALGGRTVTMTTGAEVASLVNGFTVTAGSATSMTANAGTTPQSATVGTAFANALAVTVKDAGSNPVSGVNVTFTAPGSGASGVFGNSTATITVATNASGVASAPFTANTTAGGPYAVAATLGPLSTTFTLTNLAGTPLTVVSYNVLFGARSFNLIGSTRTRLPWQITGIQVVFSRPIITGSVNSLSGVIPTGFTGLGSNTLTWTVSPLSLGSFATMLAGSGPNALTDASGTPLGGGAGFSQNLKVLWGDFNDDGVVSATDLVGVNNATAAPYNVLADINGDGVVSIADVQIVRSRVGTSLP